MNERATQSTGRRLMLAISPHGPVCPACGQDGFDDWWLGKGMRSGAAVSIEGRLKCHGCAKFFSVTQYHDGVTHSTMWRKAA